jgi:serine/threonine protein kinase/sugar lactone lactonase YvrE
MSTTGGSLHPDTLVHGRYRIVRQIGRGGMGAVYEAIDTRLGNSVALKETLVRGQRLDEAFAREARLLSALRHRALPVVSDYFAEGEGHFLVMQYIPGTDLAALMAERNAPFSSAEILSWADQLLDALDYLHTQQPPIIHRDIKPQNLKLTPRGEIVLLDFGLAKGGTGGLDAGVDASLYGYTPQFAPLEQIQGAGTGPSSDLYSLAATLYALLSNGPPPNALDRASAMLQGQPDPLPPLVSLNPEVPQAVSDLIGRAMSIQPGERPQSAAAMRAEFAAGRVGGSSAGMRTIALGGPTATHGRPAAPPQPLPANPQPPNRRLWLLPLIMLGLVLLLVGALGASLVALFSNLPRVSFEGPPTPAVAVATADPREEEDPPTIPSMEIPTVVIPAIDIPDINATVEAIQETVQASIGTGVALPGLPSGPSLGTVTLEFGEEGTADGMLDDPRGVAVGPDGAIYVADFTTGRVQRFSSEGAFERSFTVEGQGPINALAADGQGRVYVAQSAQTSVFDGATGQLFATFTDAQGGGFEDLTVLDDGSLLGIPWASGDLVWLSAEGQETNRLVDALGAADADGRLLGVEADGQGTIYALGNGEVVLFDAEGEFRGKFSAPGATFFPAIAVDGLGRVYLTAFLEGVHVFSQEGTQLGSIAMPGVAFDLTLDEAGNLYAATNAPRLLKVQLSQ